ncbi:hypothetical protein LRC484719_16340 [Mycobacterium riyadhense]
MNKATNHTLDGPAFTFTGVRLTALTVKSFFLRTLDFGICYLGLRLLLQAYLVSGLATRLTHLAP